MGSIWRNPWPPSDGLGDDTTRTPPPGPGGGSRRFYQFTVHSGTQILTTGIRRAWLDQSPFYMVEGEKLDFVIVFQASYAIALATATNILYLDGTDVSSTCLTGSTTVRGNSIITKLVSSLTGPNRYILTTTCTVSDDAGSHIYVKKLLVIVADPSDEQRGRCWIREGPQWMVQGETMYYTLTLLDAKGISGTPTAKAYKDGTDVSSTVLSGSCSVSGTTITLPAITAVTTGRYVAAVTAAVDSTTSSQRTEIYKLMVIAQNANEEF